MATSRLFRRCRQRRLLDFSCDCPLGMPRISCMPKIVRVHSLGRTARAGCSEYQCRKPRAAVELADLVPGLSRDLDRICEALSAAARAAGECRRLGPKHFARMRRFQRVFYAIEQESPGMGRRSGRVRILRPGAPGPRLSRICRPTAVPAPGRSGSGTAFPATARCRFFPRRPLNGPLFCLGGE